MLKEKNKPGLDLPNLKYVFADEIIARLSLTGNEELCSQIKNLYSIYKDFDDTYKRHKQEYIIKKLKEFYELNGRSPYTKYFSNNPDYPSATTLSTLFGSFNNALREANLPINSEPNLKFDETIAITDLLNLIIKLGRLPLTRELRPPNTTFTTKVYFKYWGGVKCCLIDMGFDYSELEQISTNNKNIITLNKVIAFNNSYNRLPNPNELFNKNNLPSAYWVHNHFGNLPNLINHLEITLSITNP